MQKTVQHTVQKALQRAMQGAALGVLLHFAAVLLLAAQPQWHLAAHDDAGEVHHQCAVTLITSGGLDLAGETRLPMAAQRFEEAPDAIAHGVRLESAHLERSIWERGPPRSRQGATHS